ncbi:MAG: hypothetical protein ACTHJV_10370 [Rhizobiaceae bacterium]
MDGFLISMNGVLTHIGPADEHEWQFHESLIRADYDRCHSGETFDDLKYRARFSKEDQGLLLAWMRLAAQRAAQQQRNQIAEAQPMAA